ncbi:MAG TPA: 4-hydroxythreonine-4-phosphate dehydrogenase PdxA [Oligoflexus sp.]|uniref:PdxA family dehydrogenase n=1 Tax=Oligoflexus sp. TaxID=1971216 RepID=UPI002D528E52|nr:4-hydroxythreonine-4-phosphate dehydrogenase PdxA [Oligoflexus sp.]HYX33041.1 4-hydroxythreonine-4-phosphate dehydrogenase PdxA [Oligoflexus sp.]
MLIITLGDPLSVAVECLVREKNLWADDPTRIVVVVGARTQWLQQSSVPFRFKEIKQWAAISGPGLYFFDSSPDCPAVDPRQLTDEQRGQVAFAALSALRSLPPDQKSLAIMTSPIDKSCCAKAGFRFPGQTEFFEDLWGAQGIMILAGSKLRVALATNHLALRDVPAAIRSDLIVQKARLLQGSLQRIFGLQKPRLAVAGLNPHCGDGGLFGDEDTRILVPAVEEAKRLGLDIVGPLPADTIFFRAYSGAFDGVLAMYHDQGLGPLKSLHFYDAINVTGGLAHLRLSPDHGPAAELYGRNEARSDSFRLALQQARHYLGW